MTPPKGAGLEDGTIWKVSKPIYALRDAAKYRHRTFKKFLEGVGARESIADPSMFYWPVHGQVSFFGKPVCATWEDFDLAKLPNELNGNIGTGKVFGCVAIHVEDVAIFGRMDFVE